MSASPGGGHRACLLKPSWPAPPVPAAAAATALPSTCPDTRSRGPLADSCVLPTRACVCARRRGYDVVAFASAGAARSVGLEISPTAVQEAHAYLQQAVPGDGDSSKKAEVLLADFFTWSDPDGPFDCGFDYTVSEGRVPGQVAVSGRSAD